MRTMTKKAIHKGRNMKAGFISEIVGKNWNSWRVYCKRRGDCPYDPIVIRGFLKEKTK